MSERIRPRTLKGFRDYLPESMLPREHLIDTAKDVYRSYGYSPIDTPALEYADILLGKGGDESDKQLYRFDDQGGRDVALRFDLTVPLARFIAQHAGELGTPFKRYHVGPVWRGENTQRGRYREFVQCDFDTIGTESLVADVEAGQVIDSLISALGFSDFTIRVNNRRILAGILELLGLAAESVAVLRALDKLSKAGPGAVRAELTEAGVSAGQADEIVALADLTGTPDKAFDEIGRLVAGSDPGEAGSRRLADVVDGMISGGVPAARIVVDVATARGLDYYTGTVYETFLDDLPDIGSVCSGGRYDDLASLYTSTRLPGVGASLGVDRLLAAIDELGLVEGTRTPAQVLVVYFAEERWKDHVALATELRAAGIATELYPEPRKLSTQLKYADRRGHRAAVIVGDREAAAGVAQVKDLATGQASEVARSDLAAACRRLLGL